MAVIRIDNFGGEIPRLPARALPAGAAQVSQNLLATATEFRPLQDDAVVVAGGITPGSQALYRLSKDANGVVRTLDSAGWLVSAGSKNYVKGQINDDGSERTYISTNDGSAPPHATDTSGASRQLGVPAPLAITASKTPGNAFTGSEANAWASDTLLPALHALFASALSDAGDSANQVNRRFSASPIAAPIAGAYAMYGMTHNSSFPWLAQRSINLTDAKAAGLNEPVLAPQISGNILTLQVSCLPFWGLLNQAAVASGLATLQSPRGGLLLSDTQKSSLLAALVAHFDPNGPTVKTLRIAIDAQIKAFNSAIDFLLTAPAAEPVFTLQPPAGSRYPDPVFSGGA